MWELLQVAESQKSVAPRRFAARHATGTLEVLEMELK